MYELLALIKQMI